MLGPGHFQQENGINLLVGVSSKRGGELCGDPKEFTIQVNVYDHVHWIRQEIGKVYIYLSISIYLSICARLHFMKIFLLNH